MAVFQPPPTWASPILVDERTKQAQFNPVWLKWFVDLVGIINATGGGSTVLHNGTGGLQGGQVNQYYHFTATEYTKWQAITATAAALNAAAAYIAALTATTAQVNQLASGLTVVITTAKLTGLGANGSMTFTNGVLTAQTAAT